MKSEQNSSFDPMANQGFLHYGVWLLLAGLILFVAHPAAAQITANAKKAGSAQRPAEYLLSADTITNDENASLVTADGKVEILNDDQLLQATHVSMDNLHDIVNAKDHVSVLQKDGTILFAKDGTFSSSFSDGFASGTSMLMPDGGRFTAIDGRRAVNRYMLFEHGIYSPCAPCIADPRKAPLWQLRADKVTHDNTEHTIMYEDATMEIYGEPILYVPYFSHPDPTVKRKSGFLTPTVGSNSNIGVFARMPYYYDISPDADYTAIPTFSGTDKVRYEGIWRQRFENGAILFDHSLSQADRTNESGIIKPDQLRGHLAGFAHFDIDNVFRTGADFALITDKTYLNRYGEALDDVLTNRVFLEGFKGRNFGAAEFYYFQDNRPGAFPDQPLVLPRLRYSAFGEPNQTLGGRWSFNGNATSLRRDNGTNTTKFGLDFGWDRRDVLPGGFVNTLHGDARNDFFWAQQLNDTQDTNITFKDAKTNRLLAQGQSMLSYPLAQHYSGFSHTIEPVVALDASPTRKLAPRIPNEDSLDVEFDTTNLFDLNRYPGSDAQEQGVRAAYGLRTGFYGDHSGVGEFMFGQNYRFTNDPSFPAGSGLETRLSDYVGQLKLEPAAWLRADYLFRLDKDSFGFNKQDASASFGIPEFRPRMTYTYIHPPILNSTPPTGKVDQLIYGFSSNFIKFWTFNLDQTRNISPPNKGVLSTTAALIYEDECLNSSINFTRDNTQRTDVNSGNSVLFKLIFKHLGGIESSAK